MAVHGDIKSVNFTHPDSAIGSGVLRPKANEGNTFDIGGVRNNDDANMITGSGTIMYVKNLSVGFFEIVVENDMNVAQDNKKVSLMHASPLDATWTVSHINGSVYKAKGQPVGDVQVDVNAGTFTVKVVGLWEKIA